LDFGHHLVGVDGFGFLVGDRFVLVNEMVVEEKFKFIRILSPILVDSKPVTNTRPLSSPSMLRVLDILVQLVYTVELYQCKVDIWEEGLVFLSLHACHFS